MWDGLGDPAEEPGPEHEDDGYLQPWRADAVEPKCVAEQGFTSDWGGIEADVPFALALLPLVQIAWERLHSDALEAGVTFAAGVGLRRALLCRLSEVVARPLGKLFSGDRTLADVAFDRLADGRPAGSSTSRYEEFSYRLSTTGFEALFQHFPVTERLMGTVVTNWIAATSEFLSRIAADRHCIEATFGIPSQADITSVASGLSDSHRLGRSVIILSFGEQHRLVYKPRPVDIEERYQDCVGEIGSLLPGNPLRRLRVLPCEGYGYIEYISARPASGAEELASYYVNAGRVLALLYLLGATDCHWENMIAAGDQLVLIDAETLLEGTPASPEADRTAELLGSDGMEGSVLRTGMLPMWISTGPARAIDVSALGVPGSEQDLPNSPNWCFINTDDMVWGDRRVDPRDPMCLPVSGGEANPLETYQPELVRGFEEMMGVLASPPGRATACSLVNAFRGCRRRIVVRPTRTYALLHLEALEPDVLGDPNSRALRLERLTRAYVGESDIPKTWPLLHHELSAMEDLDVPYFEGVVGSQDLFVGPDVVVAGYYQREGLGEALRRIALLSETECTWQVRLIHGALAAHRFQMAARVEAASSDLPLGDPSQIQDVHAIIGLIKAEVVEDPRGRPTWLTVALLADATRVQLGLVPPGLYDGRAGIAAFLYDCGQQALAEEVMQPVVEMIAHRDKARAVRYLRTIGMGTTGVGGLLRLFQYRSERDCRGNGSWDELTARVIGLLSDDLLEADTASDLVSGLAALAAPVSRMHSRSPTPDSDRVLRSVGRLLLQRQGDSGGWTLAPGHPSLVGLSHGASGIAVGLAEIAVALSDPRYGGAVARALDFETAMYDPEARNWPDLRIGTPPEARVAMRSWCHGSVGVALARLRITELLPRHPSVTRWQLELSDAIESTIDAKFGEVDHLCCGNAGRAVAIILAGQVTGNRRWEEEGRLLSEAVWAAAGGDASRCRLLLGIEAESGLRLPGLMTGLAGLGMVLLHGSDLHWVRHLLL